MEILSFSAPDDYPEITVCGPNPAYAAAMLDNIGSCDSEMSAVSLYFYNHVITRGCAPDLSRCFHGISVVEMHHLQIFGTLAHLLGADPRLWNYRRHRPDYWSPACNRYIKSVPALLQNALEGEKKAISKYRRQAHVIQDSHVAALLERIILDEELHVRILKQLLEAQA